MNTKHGRICMTCISLHEPAAKNSVPPYSMSLPVPSTVEWGACVRSWCPMGLISGAVRIVDGLHSTQWRACQLVLHGIPMRRLALKAGTLDLESDGMSCLKNILSHLIR